LVFEPVGGKARPYQADKPAEPFAAAAGIVNDLAAIGVRAAQFRQRILKLPECYAAEPMLDRLIVLKEFERHGQVPSTAPARVVKIYYALFSERNQNFPAC
jgi:hypothetical protein